MNFSAEVMFFECFPANGAHPGGASNLRFCVYLQFFLQFFCVLFFFCVVFYKGPRYICLDPQWSSILKPSFLKRNPTDLFWRCFGPSFCSQWNAWYGGGTCFFVFKASPHSPDLRGSANIKTREQEPWDRAAFSTPPPFRNHLPHFCDLISKVSNVRKGLHDNGVGLLRRAHWGTPMYHKMPRPHQTQTGKKWSTECLVDHIVLCGFQQSFGWVLECEPSKKKPMKPFNGWRCSFVGGAKGSLPLARSWGCHHLCHGYAPITPESDFVSKKRFWFWIFKFEAINLPRVSIFLLLY